jgi:hypothetical protein
MKQFEYIWASDNIFLLHVQFNAAGKKHKVFICREYEGQTKKEELDIKDQKSYRMIVSRTHPKERRVVIEYPQENNIEVFKVDDRAYYPTESFYVG